MNTLIALGVLVVIIIYFVSIFNNLVALKNQYLNAFAQIEVQLKRRYDLIPNLVETAKGYLKHEAATLEAVVQARNSAAKSLQEASKHLSDPSAINSINKAEAQLSSAMGSFNLVMEAYPDLKANENMIRLHEELTSTENKVAFARQAFNDFVMSYNTYKQSFPNSLIANNFGHAQDATLLEFENSAAIQEAVKVSF